MKKIMSICVIVALIATSVMVLTGCNGASDEQMKSMEEKLTKYEKIVSDAGEEVKYLKDYADVIQDFDQIETQYDEISKQAKELRTKFDENKDSYDSEQADKIIKSLDEQIKSGETYLNELKDTTAQVEEAVSE